MLDCAVEEHAGGSGLLDGGEGLWLVGGEVLLGGVIGLLDAKRAVEVAGEKEGVAGVGDVEHDGEDEHAEAGDGPEGALGDCVLKRVLLPEGCEREDGGGEEG